jgi:hypothetical protein
VHFNMVECQEDKEGHSLYDRHVGRNNLVHSHTSKNGHAWFTNNLIEPFFQSIIPFTLNLMSVY